EAAMLRWMRAPAVAACSFGRTTLFDSKTAAAAVFGERNEEVARHRRIPAARQDAGIDAPARRLDACGPRRARRQRRAAGMEPASGRDPGRIGWLPAEDERWAPGAGRSHREEGPRVRMLRRGQDR